jgi:hypothetical protein
MDTCLLHYSLTKHQCIYLYLLFHSVSTLFTMKRLNHDLYLPMSFNEELLNE